MIILEGPDLSGKSTIGARLEELTPLKVFHAGGPPTARDEVYTRILDYPAGCICDRHVTISEQVYGNLGLGVQLVETYTFDLWIAFNKPLILFCDPGLDHLIDNLKYLKTKPHKDTLHVNRVRRNFERIYYKYQSVMEKLKIHTQVKTVDFRTITDNELLHLCYLKRKR